MTTHYKRDMRIDAFRRKALDEAKRLGYSSDILERIVTAREITPMKQALVIGKNEFRTYKKEAIIAVKDFGYGDDILEQVNNAKTIRDITIIMNEARKRFDWEPRESVEAYDQRINKDVQYFR